MSVVNFLQITLESNFTLINENFSTHSEKLIFYGANMNSIFELKLTVYLKKNNNLSIEFTCEIIRIFGKNVKID